ncbi:MAG: tetratricopeptide repeat protein [Candidatus Electronema sp. VV]
MDDNRELAIKEAKLKVERLQLEVEKERLDFEKRKTEGINSLLVKNFGMLITASISLVAVLVSASQVWVAYINKARELEINYLTREKEQKLKEKEQEQQWRFKLANFVSENMELMFSGDIEKRTSIRDVLLVSFPSIYTRSLFEKLKVTASDADKKFWEKGEELSFNVLLREARDMSEEEVSNIELKLNDYPNDLLLRSQLIAYFFLKKSDHAKREHRKHVFWVIENNPASEIAGRPEIWLLPTANKDYYDKAKKLWLQMVSNNPKNPKILGNAAYCIMHDDPDQAETLLIKAKSLEPSNIKWTYLLSICYGRKMRLTDGEEKKNAALNALRQNEILLLSKEGNERFYTLTALVEISFEAGELEKTKIYANELLNITESYRNDWNYGNAIHKGNIFLGRLAIIAGNIESAKEYLMQAGKTPGSPQLNSFGPNLSLARELLSLGESDIVINYLRLCSKFWESNDGLIKKWEEKIRKGEFPEFKKDS